MDPGNNPFSPGAGAPPPELAGRDAIRENVDVALRRLARGRSEQSVLLVGLRGVGKTVLLRRMGRDAAHRGFRIVTLEADAERSLPAILAPALRTMLLELSVVDRVRDAAHRALRGVAGFVRGLSVKYGDLELTQTAEPLPGLADNGDLETDLTDLLRVVGEAAALAGTVVVLMVDEMQALPSAQMKALILALHRCSQDELPITLVGAGLPSLLERLGNTKSYAERLFAFSRIGPLDETSARRAIVGPLAEEEVEIESAAFDLLFERTGGYPYFLQEWGKRAWNVAERTPISREDVEIAGEIALATLDESFFRVRFNRITPSEREYLAAMARFGPGPYRSGDVAQRLGRQAQKVSQTRADLIDKGMVWSPQHGYVDFTVPLFDDFMRRAMPEDL